MWSVDWLFAENRVVVALPLLEVDYTRLPAGLALFVDSEAVPGGTYERIVRYDLDDGGNNPGFTHPLVPEPREGCETVR